MSDLLKVYGSDPVRGACNSIGQPETSSQVREPGRRSPKDRSMGANSLNSFQLSFISFEALIQLRRDVSSEIDRRKKENSVLNRRRNITQKNRKSFNSIQDIDDYNCSGLLSVPPFSSAGIQQRLCSKKRYLRSLLSQDWSDLFPSVASDEIFYVYAHVDPSQPCFVALDDCGGNYGGTPFYIGKGCGDRAYDLKRNQAHGKYLKRILEKGFSAQDIVKIIAADLTESRALELESKLIYFFGTVYEKPEGALVNLDIPKRPNFKTGMNRYPTEKQLKAMSGDR
jgi:hypothetical protein